MWDMPIIHALLALALAAPFAYTPDETALLKQLRANPKDGALLVRLGKTLAARKAYDQANECFEILAEQHPDQPQFTVAAARTLLRQGKRQRALEMAQDLARRYPDLPAVERLLADLGVAVPPRVDVKDVSTFRKILATEHCFLHAQRVRAGLARYNTSKGLGLTLRAQNWSKIIADLAKYGYLDRAWSEPAGGEFRSRPDGTVYCTVHGEPAKATLPRLARARLAPTLIDDLLANPAPSTVVGLAWLAAGEERLDLIPRLAPLLAAIPDPASLALALELLDLLLPAPGAPPLPASFDAKPLLTHADAEVRARAAVFLMRQGASAALDAAGAIRAVDLAAADEAAPSELANLLASVPPAGRAALAAFASSMTYAQAVVAVPGLAALNDPPIQAALSAKWANLLAPK